MAEKISEKTDKKQVEKKETKKIKDKKAVKKQDRPLAKSENPFGALSFVLMTEKSIQLIESQNKMVFIVRRTASKKQIKDACEDVFQERVSDVRTLIDMEGRKKAFVKFEKEGIAGEIAIRLGII